MDEIAAYNRERWNALAAAGAVFTRPRLELDAARAQQMLDSERRLGDIAGKRVLCLACGGGQQSVAFALLGAEVTVVDLSPAQLERDSQAAAHYNVALTVLEADMRDLSRLPAAGFDVVYHPYSIGFVPAASDVFRQVARVIRPGGTYVFTCSNPFTLGISQADWTGSGYALSLPYVDGAALEYADQPWVYDRASAAGPVAPPREFRHTLGSLVSGLVASGFVLRHLADDADFWPDAGAEPGSWEHFVAFAPPWLRFWTVYRPDVFAE